MSIKERYEAAAGTVKTFAVTMTIGFSFEAENERSAKWILENIDLSNEILYDFDVFDFVLPKFRKRISCTRQGG